MLPGALVRSVGLGQPLEGGNALGRVLWATLRGQCTGRGALGRSVAGLREHLPHCLGLCVLAHSSKQLWWAWDPIIFLGLAQLSLSCLGTTKEVPRLPVSMRSSICVRAHIRTCVLGSWPICPQASLTGVTDTHQDLWWELLHRLVHDPTQPCSVASVCG